MNDILKRIFNELDNQGKDATNMCKELGIANSTFFTWKSKDKIPTTEALQKISNYLNISMDYLVNGTQNWQPRITPKDEKDIKKSLEDFKNQLSTSTGIMYDGEPLDEEDQEAILAAIEVAERTAILAAKKKFTPNKYKK